MISGGGSSRVRFQLGPLRFDRSALFSGPRFRSDDYQVITTEDRPVGGAQQEFSSERRIPPVKETIIEPANPLNMRVVGILALRELAAIKQAA